jgi:hypothetical protein
MRSEIKAMEWAEGRFGCMFFSTGGVAGDLESIDVDPQTAKPIAKVVIEVTTSPGAQLEKKALRSAQSYADFRGRAPTMVVGVRTNQTGSKVVELKEIASPPVHVTSPGDDYFRRSEK